MAYCALTLNLVGGELRCCWCCLSLTQRVGGIGGQEDGEDNENEYYRTHT